jgi:hypothetical protein
LEETADLRRDKEEGSFLPRKFARLDHEGSGPVQESHKRSAASSSDNNPNSLLDAIPVIEL